MCRNVAKGQAVPDLGANPELEGNVAALKAGEVSPVVQVGANKLAVAAVTSVQPAKPAIGRGGKPDPRIADRSEGLPVDSAACERDDRKLKGLQNSGELSATAKAIGGEVKSTQFFTIEGAADGIGPASYLAEAFTKPVGATVGPFTIGNQVFLAKVSDKQVADPGGMQAARDQLVLALKQKKAQERKELFEDGLVTRLIKEGKVKKYQDTIKRLLTQYQG